MYNQSDVESLLESIADSTKVGRGSACRRRTHPQARCAPADRVQLRVEEALKRTEHMNALLLKMAITDAAERGVALDVDPRRAEDASLLAEVEQFRQGRLDMAKRVSRTVKLVRARAALQPRRIVGDAPAGRSRWARTPGGCGTISMQRGRKMRR